MAVRKFVIDPVMQLAREGRLSGLLLIAATAISLFLSNSGTSAAYADIWNFKAGVPFLRMNLLHWINDALMPVFFLLAGIEIKREMKSGELSSYRQAILPVAAALGGIIVPALTYILFNFRNPVTIAGWAIPTATDIAFSLGILSLLGNRVPPGLKVFLTALAIIDDLAAILIIAFFYSHSLNLLMLLLAAIIMAGMIVMNRLGVKRFGLYIIPGILLWYFILNSGIHPTIAGVLLAFAIPVPTAVKAEEGLSKMVYYLILPLFALANTAIILDTSMNGNIFSSMNLGIFIGLFTGKPVGILLFSLVLAGTGLSRLPSGVDWKHMAGMGMLAGIGFTMSIFIATLSFSDVSLMSSAKLMVLAASLCAGLAGAILLIAGSRSKSHDPFQKIP